MAAISVIHDDPNAMGGAEAVFMHTLEALQDDHTVTAITAKPFDIATLNEYYGTSVESLKNKTPSIPIVGWSTAHEWADRLSSGKLGVLHTGRILLFHWAAIREANADLIIHTYQESPYGSPSIQYIHHPWFLRRPSAALETPDNSKLALLERLLSPITGPGDFPPNTVLLTNSAWTAADLKSVYNVDATVCPPPIETADIPPPLPDRERENAVIMVGRIAPKKRQHLAFEIVKAVRDRGHDLELTIVGPTNDEEYAADITARAADYEWATIKGRVPRDDLVDLLASHRYGLHAHPHEHFGIVVAEMVAGGCLPLVPNDGGQVEIVNGINELTWNDVDEAVTRLDALCDDSALRDSIRSRLPQIEQKYGTERFQREMQKHVQSVFNS